MGRYNPWHNSLMDRGFWGLLPLVSLPTGFIWEYRRDIVGLLRETEERSTPFWQTLIKGVE
jgi:hypothetical protein